MQLKIDPEFKSLIPSLSEDERTELRTSLLTEGCRDALVTWQGVIIDGHNRYELCSELNIPYQTIEREFEDRNAVMLWMIKNQFARRNLNMYTRATLAAKAKPLIAERAKAKQRGGQGGVLLSQNSVEAIDTQKELAALAGTSHDTIHKVETVEAKAPDAVKEKARNGGMSANRAYMITKELENTPGEYRDKCAALCGDELQKLKILTRLYKSAGSPQTNGTFFEIMATGGFHYGDDMERWCDFANDSIEKIEAALKSVAKHHAREERAARQEQRAESIAALPDKVYNVIMADPPWQYNNTGVHGAAEGHYDTMTTGAICDYLDSLNVSIDKNAVLFMWVTNPTMEDALKVIEAWGFKYKTNMVWVKTELKKPGSGFYVRGRHELLFICTRGSMTPLVDVSPPIGSVVSAPLGEHSEKPTEFYEIVERLYPGCNYLELFARSKRDGWEFLGEVD